MPTAPVSPRPKSRPMPAYMAAKLKPHGWQYIVVDIQWSDPLAKPHGYRPDAELAMDPYGRLIPAANRFPSAASKPLPTDLHARGLKFGIHIMRGIPRRAVAANLPIYGSKAHAADIADPKSICKWNTDMYGVDMTKPGAQDYYDSILGLYAGWGVDFIKCDDIAQPFHGDEIAALHKAILKTGRPIVLSLSPGPADLAKAAFYAANANLWRISDDFWDLWSDLRKSFDLLDKWSPTSKPGGVARRRHAAAGPHRHPRRTRQRPPHALHTGRAAHPDYALVHRPQPAHVRRRPAQQRRLHRIAAHQR